jgi:ferric-dicitrate binding protein FerR (iron transport regulator)
MPHQFNGNQDESDLVASLIRAAGRRAPPPDDAYRQVLAAATAAFRDRKAQRFERNGLLAAAAVVVAAIAVALVLQWSPASLQPRVATVVRLVGGVELGTGEGWQTLVDANGTLAPGARLRTLRGGGAALALDDGASLRLAATTEVTLNGSRDVTLQSGTLYLDHRGRPGVGYRIETPAGTARDLGTQFELQVHEGLLRLRVREGRVEIDRAGQVVTGSAGEQLEFDRLGGVVRSPIAANDRAWQWVETVAPTPDMDGKSAAALIAWVARETGHRLQYESPAVQQRAATVILHGNIRHLTPLAALDAMLATTDLVYVLRDDTMEILARDTRSPWP